MTNPDALCIMKVDAIVKLSVEELVGQTGRRTPVPGGGSIAAVCAALAGAVGQMAVSYSPAEHGKGRSIAEKRLHSLSGQLLKLAQKDVDAYGRLARFWKQRARMPGRFAQALLRASKVPMQIMTKSVEILEVLDGSAGTIKPMLRSDAAVCACLCDAVVHAVWVTAQANIRLLEDDMIRRQALREGRGLVRRAENRTRRILAACRHEA